MSEELGKQLRFYCNDLVTLQTPDITAFRNVNRLLSSLFHSSYIANPGFRILQDRIRELRRLERERNKIIQRNYLLVDQHRGEEQEDKLMNKTYALPHEIFKNIFLFL